MADPLLSTVVAYLAALDHEAYQRCVYGIAARTLAGTLPPLDLLEATRARIEAERALREALAEAGAQGEGGG